MIKCYGIFHDWLQWKTIGTGYIVHRNVKTGYWERQRRVCSKCGKSKIRVTIT